MLQSQWDIDVRAASEEPWREKRVAGELHRGARQAASPADWVMLGGPGSQNSRDSLRMG